ncbi:MAG: HAD-IA family hydrolase, partial [Planctomycetales bacterium]|nr:HAD-IA family hydrolase [Planctomycetales bacterium]
CDGTLADTMPIHYLAWRTTLERYRIQFDEDRFYALGGCPPAKIVKMLADEQQVTVDALAVAEEKESCFLASLGQVLPITPVVDVARAHHGRLPMGVGSGSGRDIVRDILQRLGIAQLFQCVVGSEDTEHHKPEPDVFLRVASLLGVAPQACCVYEDSDLGIEAARRAGMQWFDVRTVHTPKRWT